MMQPSKISKRLSFIGIARILAILLIPIFTTSCNILQNNVGEAAVLLVKLDWPPAGHVVWSPSEDLLAYTASSFSRNIAKINLFNIKTDQIQTLVETPEHGGLIAADSWSPDGSQLVFTSAGGIVFEKGIWLLDVGGKKEPEFIGDGFLAAWSPKGVLAIAKADIIADIISIYIYNLQMQKEEVVFSGPVIILSGLSWSPDGKKLVFALKRVGESSQGDIYIVDIDTKGVLQLTSDGRNLYPEWSPRADMIAYTKVNIGENIPTYLLHIMNSDGSCDIQASGLSKVMGPTWSPDGMQIAFIADGVIYRVELIDVFGNKFLKEDFPCP